MSKDISRYLLQPEKHYSGVRMQQGRVILDSDWNESEGIDAEESRRNALDTIGPHGTPNDGFKIANPAKVTLPTGDTYDFDISPGSYHIGGLRFDQDNDTEKFLSQDDWPLITGAPARNLPSVTTTSRWDMVYLMGWEQTVTQTEDSELIEKALGGVDTSVRVRRMSRVKVHENVGSGVCAEAFSRVISDIETAANATFDWNTFELKSKARLTVRLSESDPSNVPCDEAVPGGFLGAENETIRVQITKEGNRFIWGRDNASPLYCVEIVTGPGGELTGIRFDTPPRDQASQPLAGQAVEILPRGATLPNGQYLAENLGKIFKVTKSYGTMAETENYQLTIDTASFSDTEWTTWTEWLDAHKLPSDTGYKFFLRLWTGANPAPDGPTYAVQTTSEVTLGNTGIKIKFQNEGCPGDHWIISARPKTPHEVVPWNLVPTGTEPNSGAPPAGVRWFFAPLGLVQWNDDGTVTAHDCRRIYRTLTEIGGGCTVTVGDGLVSHGDTTSIQDAINQLPPAGGKICLLPGTYAGRFEIRGRKCITIEGCGPRSMVVNPDGATVLTSGSTSEPEPLIKICDSNGITFRNFAVTATGLTGIFMHATVPTGMFSDVLLEKMVLNANGNGDTEAIAMPAVDIREGRRVTIRDCKVFMGDQYTSFYPALYLQGEQLRIEQNRIMTGYELDYSNPLPFDYSLVNAWGGIQLACGSIDVEIKDNEIIGGLGFGIALGSIVYQYQEGATTHVKTIPLGESLITMGSNMEFKLLALPRSFDIDETTSTSFDARPAPGELRDIRIISNRILCHRGSGISTAAFFDSTQAPFPLDPFSSDSDNFFIRANDLLIEDNDIQGNMIYAPAMYAHPLDTPSGGIALACATGSRILSNVITQNGITWEQSSPMAGIPVVGVGIVGARNVVVSDNKIYKNGEETESATMLRPGFRGGIAVRYGTLERESSGFQARALTIHNNQVRQPEGKALWLGMYQEGIRGPISVCQNVLESFGDNSMDFPLTVPNSEGNLHPADFAFGTSTHPGKGACVEITNRGLALDADRSSVESLGDPCDGRVLFHENQTKLTWMKNGGACSSVLILSSDHVSLQGNELLTNMKNSLSPETDPIDFINLINTGGSLSSRSFLLFHAIALGRTVNASMNRFTEGRTDAASSLLVIKRDVAQEPEPWNTDFGVVMARNIATHCVYQEPYYSHLIDDIRDNQILIVDVATCAGYIEATPADFPIHYVLRTGTKPTA